MLFTTTTHLGILYCAVVNLKEAFDYTCIWLVGLRAKRYSIISMVRMLKYEKAHTVTVGLVYVLLEEIPTSLFAIRVCTR